MFLHSSIISFLRKNKYEFTLDEIKEQLPQNIPRKTIYNTINGLRRDAIIRIYRKYSSVNYYSFVLSRTHIERVPKVKMGFDAIYNTIFPFTMSRYENSRRMANVLINYLQAGRMGFTSLELRDEANVTINNVHNFLRNFITADMMRFNNGKYYFCIDCDETEELFQETPSTSDTNNNDDYSEEVMRLIHNLCESGISGKRDKRIGSVIQSCLEKGVITSEDYEKIGELKKMHTDMVFAK